MDEWLYIPVFCVDVIIIYTCLNPEVGLGYPPPPTPPPPTHTGCYNIENPTVAHIKLVKYQLYMSNVIPLLTLWNYVSFALRHCCRDVIDRAMMKPDRTEDELTISNHPFYDTSQIAKFMWPTWGPPGSCRPQMGPMLVPWTLLSGIICVVTWTVGPPFTNMV